VVLLSALLFASGAAALVYELAWARWLTLTLGASAEGLAVVTASTMLGFALGAALLAPRVDRGSRPLRTYALLELAIGSAAAIVSLVLVDAPTAAWSAAVPRAVLVLLALVLVGVPTALMGATLPAVVAFVGRHVEERTRGHLGVLYAANTAGAVLGTLVMGFVLVERLGYASSAAVGVALNLAVGALALFLDAREGPEVAREIEASGSPALAEPTTTQRPDRAAARDALLAAAVSGFCVLAHEVLSARLLVYGLFATAHAIAIILAVYLAGLAIGARLVVEAIRRERVSAVHLGLALLGAAAVTLAFSRSLAEASALVTVLRGNRVDWSVRIAVEVAVSALLLLVPAIAMGTVFPLASTLATDARAPGRTLGRAVFLNTAFGALGALGAGFVLVPLAGVRGAIGIVVAVQALAGAWIVARHAPAWRSGAVGSSVALAALSVLFGRPATPGGPPGESTLVPQHVVDHESEYRVRCYREGPTAVTEVLEHVPSGRIDVLIDGFVAAGTSAGAGYMRLMGDVPMALHPSPQRALVICFGTGTTTRAVADAALATTPTALVEVVDLNPDVYACAAESSPDNPAVLARISAHVEDGRTFLRHGTERYDVITQEPMPPHFAGVAALYSVEHYRLARARLEDDGVMVQWLPMHLTAPDDARQIAAAALAVFPETWMVITPNDFTGLLVMSPSPIPEERRRAVDARFGTAFALDPAALARFVAGAPPVTDDQPRLEHSGIDRVLGEFGSASALLEHNLGRVIAAQAGAASASH
jgi:spermidine synthase